MVGLATALPPQVNLFPAWSMAAAYTRLDMRDFEDSKHRIRQRPTRLLTATKVMLRRCRSRARVTVSDEALGIGSPTQPD